jgi:hypothetical protein
VTIPPLAGPAGNGTVPGKSEGAGSHAASQSR